MAVSFSIPHIRLGGQAYKIGVYLPAVDPPQVKSQMTGGRLMQSKRDVSVKRATSTMLDRDRLRDQYEVKQRETAFRPIIAFDSPNRR